MVLVGSFDFLIPVTTLVVAGFFIGLRPPEPPATGRTGDDTV